MRLACGTVIPALSLLLAAPTLALSWGKAGHRVVATIAATLLTAEAQAQVTTLFDPGVTLADISTWADDIRPSRPNTAPWHYVTIPRGAAGYNAQRDCSHGCAVSAIEQSLRLLQDPSKGRAVRQEALTWVVHFVADLHQPLHAIADDRGGNDILVQFGGRQTTLHRLWDVDLIERAYPRQKMLEDQVLTTLQTVNWRVWQGRTPPGLGRGDASRGRRGGLPLPGQSGDRPALHREGPAVVRSPMPRSGSARRAAAPGEPWADA